MVYPCECETLVQLYLIYANLSLPLHSFHQSSQIYIIIAINITEYSLHMRCIYFVDDPIRQHQIDTICFRLYTYFIACSLCCFVLLIDLLKSA